MQSGTQHLLVTELIELVSFMNVSYLETLTSYLVGSAFKPNVFVQRVV